MFLVKKPSCLSVNEESEVNIHPQHSGAHLYLGGWQELSYVLMCYLLLLGALLVCFDPGLLLSGRRTSSFQCWGCWSTSEPRLMQKGPLHLQHWWQGSCLSWRVKGTAAIANRELWQKHGTEHLGPWKQWKSACSVGSRQFLPLNWQGAHRWQKLQTD